MKKKIIFLFIAFLFVTFSAFADVITLKSGKQIEGKILERTGDTLKVDFSGVELTYSLDDIAEVNGEKIISPAQEVGPALPAQIEQKAFVPQEQTQPEKAVSTDIPDITKTVKPVEKISFKSIDETKTFSGSNPYMGNLSPKDSISSKILLTLLGGGLFFVLILFIISIIFVYIFPSICLQLIAKKTSEGPVWWAWVPIANLFLMCKIAALSYWWLLVIFAAVIPIMGIIVNVLFCGFLYYRIALARNKPGWLGILCVLPLANLAIMGYLAFSD